MSRIGKKPITIPSGVEVKVDNGGIFGYKVVTIKGPKGELSESIRDGVDVKVDNGTIQLEKKNESKQSRAFFGLYRTIVNNMVEGVTNGFSKKLEIVGIGYRAELKGEGILMSVGLSHKIDYVPPKGITLKVADQVNITVEGIDKQLVGEVAAKLRAFRKPEPYKGKGIRYSGEKIKKKSTKSK